MKLSRLVEAAQKINGVVHRPGVAIGKTISIDGKTYELHMDPQDKRAGYHAVEVTPKFEEAFKTNQTFYVGPGGEGGIDGRYEQIGNFLNDATYITIPDVHVNAHGTVSFGNGRHRYAWMRDHGIKNFPVAMDDEALENAKKFGYVKDTLNEEIGPMAVGLMHLLSEVRKVFTVLYSHRDSKGAVNDMVLNRIYRQELKLFKVSYESLPNMVQLKFKTILGKYGISLNGGADLRRNNLQRILILKMSRLLLTFVGNQLQDPTVAVISLISRWAGTFFDILFNIRDYKDAVVELRRCFTQMMRIVNKINNVPGTDQNEDD